MLNHTKIATKSKSGRFKGGGGSSTKIGRKQSLSQLKKKCQYCGREFEVPKWRINIAKYCSYDCSNKGRTTEKAYSKERICKRCDKRYLPTQWNQKYCGRECFLLSIKKRQKIQCPTCGKKFIQTRVSQKYCSRKCGEPYKRKTAKFKPGNIDLLWGELIKLQAGVKCEYCGKTNNLNSHHIFSRSRMNLRWDTDNGVCLCVGHHVFGEFSAHKAPIDFVEWLKDKRGNEWYEKLRIKSREICKFSNIDKLAIAETLKQRIQSIKVLDKSH